MSMSIRIFYKSVYEFMSLSVSLPKIYATKFLKNYLTLIYNLTYISTA